MYGNKINNKTYIKSDIIFYISFNCDIVAIIFNKNSLFNINKRKLKKYVRNFDKLSKRYVLYTSFYVICYTDKDFNNLKNNMDHSKNNDFNMLFYSRQLRSIGKRCNMKNYSKKITIIKNKFLNHKIRK